MTTIPAYYKDAYITDVKSFITLGPDRHYVESYFIYCYAECHYAEYRHAQPHGAMFQPCSTFVGKLVPPKHTLM